jgi:hypothetical protein
MKTKKDIHTIVNVPGLTLYVGFVSSNFVDGSSGQNAEYDA